MLQGFLFQVSSLVLPRLEFSLCIECFPLTYDLNGCKSRINRHLTVGSRPWHDAWTMARIRAITRANQGKGDLGER